MVKTVFQPARGDIIWLSFDPQAGHEQAGRRPALVLSAKDFNIATGMAFVAPITNTIRGRPFEVPLPRGSGVTGVILSDQLRSLDWTARDAELKSTVDEETMCEVLGRIEAILSIDVQ